MKTILYIAVGASILAGCAGEPAHRIPEQAAPPAKAPETHYSKGGGYYLDDGPGDNPPSNIASIPDAIPRQEPLIASCNKPYTALGKTYYPETRLAPYRAEGVASWYGRRYNGAKTSSGEVYDMYAMTAAHPTLPIPSYARVENLASGKSVVVRINDRGPFRSDRLIDLSYTAAYRLGILKGGSAKVAVESILPEAYSQTSAAHQAGGVYLQLGAFSEKINAEHFLEKHRLELAGYDPEVIGSGRLFKVHVGPFASREEAELTADKIAQSLDVRPVVMRQ